MGEVRAVGTAVATRWTPRGRLIETVMVEAIEDCLARGITDDACLREAQRAARRAAQRVLEVCDASMLDRTGE